MLETKENIVYAVKKGVPGFRFTSTRDVNRIAMFDDYFEACAYVIHNISDYMVDDPSISFGESFLIGVLRNNITVYKEIKTYTEEVNLGHKFITPDSTS